MKLTLISLLLISTVFGYSQIKYEKGYFVDNNDKKIECLILNDAPKDNPTKIKYKLTEESDFLVASIRDVKEFGVSNNRFIRSNVQLDKSSQDLKKLTDSRVPEWVDRQIFLKVIVDGKADLFYYSGEELVLFFFRIDDSSIEQLIYKHYTTTETRSIAVLSADQKMRKTIGPTINTNLTYINQLNAQVSCKNVPTLTQKNIQYHGKALAEYFIKINTCTGAEFVSYEDHFENKFHLSLRPGADFSTERIDSYYGLIKDFPNRQLRFRMGIEAEFLLPVKKGKWRLIVEPTYQSYQSKTLPEETYRSLEVPFGIRHYIFLGKHASIFVNAAPVIDVPLNQSIRFKNGVSAESKTAKFNYTVGAGISYKKLSIEGRYYSLRSGVDENIMYYFDFMKSSIIVGYRIL